MKLGWENKAIIRLQGAHVLKSIVCEEGEEIGGTEKLLKEMLWIGTGLGSHLKESRLQGDFCAFLLLLGNARPGRQCHLPPRAAPTTGRAVFPLPQEVTFLCVGWDRVPDLPREALGAAGST